MRTIAIGGRPGVTPAVSGIDELFGESIGKIQRRILKERYDRRDNVAPISMRPRSGEIVPPAESTRETVREVPRHRFHPFVMGDDDED